ncbi:MAG TPA: sigma-70 family RNA polymerase sigma factor [Gemmatimonadaceae bacterium]|jgi:RNA polymerase sigma factor (TIGR02999 family)
MLTRDPTTLLTEWRDGNRAAFDQLFPLVYDDLRRRAHLYLRGEREGHTLTTTALVHETYIKLLDVKRVRVEDRSHFLALAATAMRRVLVEYARRHNAIKRGGGAEPVIGSSEGNLADAMPIATERADQLLALDRALEKLGKLDERLSRLVELRFFGGMTVEATAEALDLAESTVKLDWKKAKAWLYRELAEE